MDNCEHVLDAAARLVDQIVRQCPRVAVLATSREALGVDGERMWPVPPLAVEEPRRCSPSGPRPAGPISTSTASRCGAVAEICRQARRPAAGDRAGRRADAGDEQPRPGPAAGRAAAAQPAARAARTPDSRASPRRSTGPTACWPSAEQALFMRLSVFAGGFDLEAAHGVCGADGHTEDDTLDLLTGLVDKSMVAVRSRRRPHPLPRAGDAARIRAGAAARRAASTIDVPPARGVLHRAGRARRRGHAWPPTSGRGSNACCPTTTTCAPRSSTSIADRRRRHRRCGWSRRCPNSCICASVTKPSGWAERALDLADPRPPAVRRRPSASPRGARGTAASSHRARTLASARGRPRARLAATAASPTPATYSRTSRSTRATSTPRCAHYDAEMARARRDGDPIRLVWTLFYVAICHAVRRAPERGLAAAQEAVRGRGRRRPTRRRGRWRATRWAWCSRSPIRTGRWRCSTRRRSWRRRCRTSGGTASR